MEHEAPRMPHRVETRPEHPTRLRMPLAWSFGHHTRPQAAGSNARRDYSGSVRIAWATDIHLNFLDAEQIDAFGEQVRALNADFFVVSGDIAEAPSVTKLIKACAQAAQQPMHFVLGNHDFYSGAVDPVRDEARGMDPQHGVWLPGVDPVRVDERTVMVGVDGWGDARLGDPWGTRIRLNDFIAIQDLLSPDYEELLLKLRARGDAEATTATRVLASALATDAKQIVFVTHVPPFRGACWHEGAISNDDWLPFFTCDAVGKVLERTAKQNPARDFLVLCGHTHGAGTLEVSNNLRVYTGGAEYGAPEVQLVSSQAPVM